VGSDNIGSDREEATEREATSPNKNKNARTEASHVEMSRTVLYSTAEGPGGDQLVKTCQVT
jgi:hypothetical protein